MAEHHLPDDPKDWPDDPFRLLGIEPPASEQDLRRAYVRLIRRFKPEHHPEQFRRVREAYEAAQERARWFGFFTQPDPPTVAEPTPVSSSSTAQPEPAPERETDPPRPVIVDPVEEAWELALTERRTDAYARLVDLCETSRDNPVIPVRLYWLLAVYPDLAPERSRHEWLAVALSRSRLSGPALELYFRELDVNPEIGLFGCYFRLLESDAPGSELLKVARQRLAAVGLTRSWTVLEVDLRALATRAARLDEKAWLAYLVNVMAHVGFEQPPPVFAICRQLLGGFRHLELRESWAFDHLEEQEQMALGWRLATAVPPPVHEVVRILSTTGGDGWKKSMVRAATWVANDPTSALSQFDQASGVPECRPLLTTFQRLVDECQKPAVTAYPPGLIRGLVREFLARYPGKDYVFLRPVLLQFLVNEVIDPEELVQACLVDLAPVTRSLVEHVRNDPVLRLVWRTTRAGG